MAVDALKGVERCYKFGYPCKYAFRFEQNPKIVGCIKRWGIVFVMFQRARKANGNSFIACGPADHWKEKHINIAELSFEVKQSVEGKLGREQTQKIAELGVPRTFVRKYTLRVL